MSLDVPASIAPDDMPDLLRHWYLGPPSRRHMSERRFREVDARANLQSGHCVLDIGAAWGYHVMSLSQRGVRAVGVDLVIEYMDVSHAIAAANRVPLNLVGGDATHLPFSDGAFDAITMVETIEHVFAADRPAVLRECHRVLRPGGRLVLSTPNHAGLVERTKRAASRVGWLRDRLPVMCLPAAPISKEEYHPWRYHDPIPTRDLVALVASAGFAVCDIRHFLFIMKETPRFLMPLARRAEWLAERTPGVRRLAATVRVAADRLP